MSTEVTVTDPEAVQQAFKDIYASDSSDQSYVILQHESGNPNVLTLGTTGTGIDELCSQLDDSFVQYALVKILEVVDMSNTIKFVYIHWIGDKVPMMRKGRYGVVHGSIKSQFFAQNHIDIETSSREDLTADNIMTLVNENSGTRSKVVEVNTDASVQRRGFTSTPTTQPPKSRSAIIPVSSRGPEVSHGDDVTEAIMAIRNDVNETRWTCIGYQNDDVKKPLTCVGSGMGSVDELKELLDDSTARYFLYRTTDVVDGHTTVKFVFIIWVGESLKPMAKAKLSTHKGAVEELFAPFHVVIHATANNEVSDSIICDKVQSASGTKSHVK